MKVYGWTGFRGAAVQQAFPDTAPWVRQTREIVAARSKAEVGRLTGERPDALFNLGTTGSRSEIEQALTAPGVVFWRPLDDRSGRWERSAS